MAYSIEMLSLSKIGRLLKERLGDDASQYLFPDDFEEAVVDIGFSACVIDGDSSPYDEIIFIGEAPTRMHHVGRNDLGGGGAFRKYLKATFIGTKTITSAALTLQDQLTDVVFSDELTSIEDFAFSSTSALIKNITLPNSVTGLGQGAFKGSGITGITGNGVTSLTNVTTNGNSAFASCSNLKNVSLPKCTNYVTSGTSQRGTFYNCTSLENVQLGSVGYPVSSAGQYIFQGCSSVFTVTIYTDGNYVDTAVSNIRNGAANATIIVKAASNTTYGGNSYSAGDTIKTSTP